MKEKKAFSTLNHLFRKVMRTFFGKAFRIWKGALVAHYEALELETKRNSKTRKVLFMIMCRVLKVSWASWLKYNIKVVEHRAEQRRALAMMTRVMKRFLLAPQESGFKHWHRVTMIFREEAVRDEERAHHARQRSASVADVLNVTGKAHDEMKAAHDEHKAEVSGLGSIISSFHNDTQGAIEVLTRELHDIRHNELANLRRDWEKGKKESANANKDLMTDAMNAVSYKQKKFEEEMGGKINMLASQVSA